MRKWVILLVLVLLIGCELLPKLMSANDKQQAAPVVTKQAMQPVQLEAEQVYQGDLILVNQESPVHPLGVRKDIAILAEHAELTEGYKLEDDTIALSAEVAKRFEAMVAAARKDGVRHFRINSGYRDEAAQEVLYQEKGSDYALPPGYSEHNLGLSLDVGSTQGEMSTAEEGKWLAAHAAEYGFILRYPKDKSDITGIQFEPWHFRYVGLPHSAIMKEKNWTLEEYHDYLKKHVSLQTVVDGVSYEISYVKVEGQTTIEVPAGENYALSGNNTDGVIVTVRH